MAGKESHPPPREPAGGDPPAAAGRAAGKAVGGGDLDDYPLGAPRPALHGAARRPVRLLARRGAAARLPRRPVRGGRRRRPADRPGLPRAPQVDAEAGAVLRARLGSDRVAVADARRLAQSGRRHAGLVLSSLLGAGTAAWGFFWWKHKRPRGRRRREKLVAKWDAWWQSHCWHWNLGGSHVIAVWESGVTTKVRVQGIPGQHSIQYVNQVMHLIESSVEGLADIGMIRVEAVKGNPSRVRPVLQAGEPPRPGGRVRPVARPAVSARLLRQGPDGDGGLEEAPAALQQVHDRRVAQRQEQRPPRRHRGAHRLPRQPGRC